MLHSSKNERLLAPPMFIALMLLAGCNEPNSESDRYPVAIAGNDLDPKTKPKSEPGEGADQAPKAKSLDYPDNVDIDAFGKDNYPISRTEYTSVNPEYLDEQLVRVGMGVDMSDPNAPIRRNGRNPVIDRTAKTMVPEPAPYTLNESFTLREASSAREEGDILSAYFKGSYNFVSVKAAYDQAVEEHSQSRSIYALLDSDGLTRDLDDVLGGNAPHWDRSLVPVFEGAEVDPSVYRSQFLLDFGSHYVSSVRYGYRIAIRGKMKTTDKSKQQKIQAAFNATFMSGNAGGGVDKEHQETLSQSEVELTFVATSGGLFEGDEQRPGVLTKLDDILDTLQKLREGRLVVHAAPVSMTLRTYWNLLPPEFLYARALLFDSGEPPMPEGFHGVPRGTVIAWHPHEPYRWMEESSGKPLMRIPQGWALCDGKNGTPDLSDRFVFGTADIGKLGLAGGSKTHRHTASAENPDSDQKITKRSGVGKKNDMAKANHNHTLSVSEVELHPPFVRLIYLMKL